MKKLVLGAPIVLVALSLAVQAVPYGRDHTNPPVRREPAWDRPETRELARRACFDCHSNETTWPWYTTIAPASWLTQRDVDEGRHALNFSEWDRPQREAKDAVKQVQKREMPPRLYALAHPEAQLAPAERDALAAGLRSTLGPVGRGEIDKNQKVSRERHER